MTISLIHATRGRPEKTLEIKRTWYARACDPQFVQHTYGIDMDDEATIAATEGMERVIVPNPKGCFRAYNLAADSTTGTVIVPIEDDLWPPLEWDRMIREAMADWHDKVAVLAVGDGQNQLIEWCITRNFYEERGLFHDDYFGLFGDTEWRIRARQDNVPTILAPHIVLDHRQYQPGSLIADPIYERKQSLYLADEMTFNQRGRAGWPA